MTAPPPQPDSQLPPGWPPRLPLVWDEAARTGLVPITDPRQHRWTAYHEAGHAVGTLTGRAVPACPIVRSYPVEGVWGTLVVIPSGSGAPNRMPAALAMLAGMAAEARAGNMAPWPYGVKDRRLARAALGARDDDDLTRTAVMDMMQAVAWTNTVEWVERPEVWRAIGIIAVGLMEDGEPSPARWWRLCSAAAAELHPPQDLARMSEWPGAQQARFPPPSRPKTAVGRFALDFGLPLAVLAIIMALHFLGML